MSTITKGRYHMRASTIVGALLVCSAACSGSETEPDSVKTYVGQYSVQVVESTVTQSLTGGGTFPCTNTYTMSGTVTIKVDQSTGGTQSEAIVDATQTETAFSNAATCKAKGNLTTKWNPTLVVTGAAFHFDAQQLQTNSGYNVTTKTTFDGTLANGVITGVLGLSASGSGVIGGQSSVSQSYAATVNVSLR